MRILNTLTGQIEELAPIKEKEISIYTCGPTVYDSCHIGHARSMITWDVLVRYLKALGYKVTWARNITDIDDKIINRSKELGTSPDKLARTETFKFWRDMNSLNVSVPDFEPRATENLQAMFEFIQKLIDKGFAYKTQTGDVYFRVSKCENYGQLKKLSEETLEMSRVEHRDEKENKADFALWKAFPKDEYSFESPFGKGRPGWHLECSAMINRYFGDSIDIHGGGEDLVFPHHENEIAQSEAFSDDKKPFVKYWMHNSMIMIDGRKMSKSEGNYITIEKSLEEFSGNAIRLFVLNAHYKQPLNYTNEGLKAAQSAFDSLKDLFYENNLKYLDLNLNLTEEINDFHAAMSNNMNTPSALSVIFGLRNKLKKDPKNENYAKSLCYMMKTLGFNPTETKLMSSSKLTQTDKFKKMFDFLLEQRKEAKIAKNFSLADDIRELFSSAGFELKDSPEGTSVIESA